MRKRISGRFTPSETGGREKKEKSHGFENSYFIQRLREVRKREKKDQRKKRT